MDAPIHSFFKLIKEDEFECITYDNNTRYYEMLRAIMKYPKFNGSHPIHLLYTEEAAWKTILMKEKYTKMDIELFNIKLKNIQFVHFTEIPKKTKAIFSIFDIVLILFLLMFIVVCQYDKDYNSSKNLDYFEKCINYNYYYYYKKYKLYNLNVCRNVTEWRYSA